MLHQAWQHLEIRVEVKGIPPTQSAAPAPKPMAIPPTMTAPPEKSAAYYQTPAPFKLGKKEQTKGCWVSTMKRSDGKLMEVQLTHHTVKGSGKFFSFVQGVDACFTHQQAYPDNGQCPSYKAFVEGSTRQMGKGRMFKVEGHVQCYTGQLPTDPQPFS